MLFRNFPIWIALIWAFVFVPLSASAENEAQQALAKRIETLSYHDEALNDQARANIGAPKDYARKTTYMQVSGCTGTIHNRAYVQDGAYDASLTRFELPLAVVQGPKKARRGRAQIIILEFLNPAERILRQSKISANWQEEWTQKRDDMPITRQNFPSIGFQIREDDGTKARALISAIMQYQSLYCSATS